LIGDGEIASLVERFGVGTGLTGGLVLVDDEPFNLTVLRSFLQDTWTVHEASTGEEALALAGKVPLDVVVTDHRMPGMTGVELLAELRRRRPDVAGIVLTGYADMQALESAINTANVFRFLRKPWEPPEIRRAVEQASATVAQRRTIEKLVALLAQRSDELHASLEELKAQQKVMLHLERLGTIGRLSAGITHDLRNVIVALRTVEWEIEQTTVVPALRETLTIGLRGVDNLLRTLQTLHEYARSGTLALQLKQVEPSAIVNDALTIARMELSFRLRRVTIDLGSELPPLHADQQKLTQVVLNLLRNALQATPEGGSVRVAASTGRGGDVVLAVEDEGPGVPPDVRERLFQPFASDKGEAGLGMGLYMARLIVEAHRGRIALVDRPRGGARFEVVLPSKQAVSPS
jgi:signal transduction histidine kinase